MSANNWRVCPKCLVAKNEEKDKLVKVAEDAYGEVPKEEFFRLRREADEFIVPDCETFREDFNIGIDCCGELYISYYGECEKCGFEKKFDHHE